MGTFCATLWHRARPTDARAHGTQGDPDRYLIVVFAIDDVARLDCFSVSSGSRC
eukprot:COSAG02_NODE_2263_length_9312_cov_3.608054_8_plen_54_part_00